VVELLESGRFSHGDRGMYEEIVKSLVEQDPFFVLADFRSYVECQRRVSRAWRDVDTWTRASILNTARTGQFSSDRSIHEYATRVWNIEPVAVAMPAK
jgi:starch phosphorylase